MSARAIAVAGSFAAGVAFFFHGLFTVHAGHFFSLVATERALFHNGVIIFFEIFSVSHSI